MVKGGPGWLVGERWRSVVVCKVGNWKNESVDVWIIVAGYYAFMDSLLLK